MVPARVSRAAAGGGGRRVAGIRLRLASRASARLCSGGSGSSGSSAGSASGGQTLRWLATGVALGCTLAAQRWLYSRFLQPPDGSRNPLRDQSGAMVLLDVGTTGSPPETVTQQRVGLCEVDAARFATFVAEQRVVLAAAQRRTNLAAAASLSAELHNALNGPKERVSLFGDWYFAYTTTYKLLGVAMSSAATHAVTFSTEQSLRAAVSSELQAHVARKYEAIVMRPALTDPMLHRAFLHSLRSAHTEYLEALAELDDSIRQFVAAQAKGYAAPPSSEAVVVKLDWATQLQKINHVPVQYEKNPELTLALLGTGAAIGKAVGGVAMGGAVKALVAKAVAPFAAKAAAVTMSGASVVGAAGGAVAAGPVGTVVGAAAGAAIGLGVDMGVNRGVELVQRPSFEAGAYSRPVRTIPSFPGMSLTDCLEL